MVLGPLVQLPASLWDVAKSSILLGESNKENNKNDYNNSSAKLFDAMMSTDKLVGKMAFGVAASQTPRETAALVDFFERPENGTIKL
jgi:hypothetical protein